MKISFVESQFLRENNTQQTFMVLREKKGTCAYMLKEANKKVYVVRPCIVWMKHNTCLIGIFQSLDLDFSIYFQIQDCVLYFSILFSNLRWWSTFLHLFFKSKMAVLFEVLGRRSPKVESAETRLYRTDILKL